MICFIPTIRSNKDGFQCIAELGEEARESFADKVEVDFSRCTFFEANMAAPLGAVLARIADHFNDVRIVNVPAQIESILRKNLFLIDYGYKPQEDLNFTTLPFRRFQLSDKGLFADYLQRHTTAKGIPTMSSALAKAFRQSIFEVFQNAVIHSESRLGIFVCGQFFPYKQRLDLTLVDAGVGIRTNVRRYLQDKILSSVDAIRWAIKEGNTTKSGPQPGGLGLNFLKRFIELNRGQIHIASRFGFYRYDKGNETFEKLDADFVGTVVNLEINTGDKSSYCLGSEISPKDIF